jgi:hypothetical protein
MKCIATNMISMFMRCKKLWLMNHMKRWELFGHYLWDIH